MSAHMTDLPVPIYKTTPPPRPKHQTQRSITEASFPAPKRSHHHHHHHIHRHHKDKERDRDRDRDGSGSGNTQSVEVTKSEGVSPENSRDPSRRTSLLQAAMVAGSGMGELEGFAIANGWKEERRAVKAEEVVEEKEKGVLRATELRNALNNLNTLSNDTTRRLDNTYYSVLEKVSVLQNMITSLKELAGLTKELNTEFEHESQEVVTEIETSLAGFEGFEDQRKRIEALSERVKKGREKIRVLGDRVEIVTEQVDSWEKAEGEWQERTRKRLRVLWIIMAVCGVLVLGLVAFQCTPVRTQGPGVLKGFNVSELSGNVPDLEKIKNETWTLKRKTENALEKMKAKDKEEKVEDDARLRVFDEL